MPAGPRPKAPKSCGRDGVGGGGVAAQALAPCGRGGGEAFDGLADGLANLRTSSSHPLYCSAYLTTPK
jgi:hypothetical protein